MGSKEGSPLRRQARAAEQESTGNHSFPYAWFVSVLHFQFWFSNLWRVAPQYQAVT